MSATDATDSILGHRPQSTMQMFASTIASSPEPVSEPQPIADMVAFARSASDAPARMAELCDDTFSIG